MDISVIAHQMIQLFIIIALGYILRKTGIIDQDMQKKLSKLILQCTMPALIMASVLEQDGEREYSQLGQMFAASVAIYLLIPLLGLAVTKLTRIRPDEQGLYIFMFTYSNVGFMGFPIVQSIYGSIGVLYAAVVNIVFNVTSFTLGVAWMNYDGRRIPKGVMDLKAIISPGVSVSLIAMVIYLFNIKLPDDVLSVCQTVGAITTPMAMIVIGATLGGMPVKNVFDDIRVYPFVIIKQIGLPILVWSIIQALPFDPMIRGVLTILILMPIANNSVLFANLYDKDDKLAAKVVFISTILALFTVPGMLIFLG